jgi:hypothetical protein
VYFTCATGLRTTTRGWGPAWSLAAPCMLHCGMRIMPLCGVGAPKWGKTGSRTKMVHFNHDTVHPYSTGHNPVTWHGSCKQRRTLARWHDPCTLPGQSRLSLRWHGTCTVTKRAKSRVIRMTTTGTKRRRKDLHRLEGCVLILLKARAACHYKRQRP